MSLLLLDGPASPAIAVRQGLVRADHKALHDDSGVIHPLGLTFFWALYGWRHERQRILDHLAWLAPFGYDYLRILAEVDWPGRSIDPRWPDYVATLQGFVDAAYDHGLRSEVTIIGGRQFDAAGDRRFVPTELARTVASALADRAHKVLHYEMCNEWHRLDKASPVDLVEMAQVVRPIAPNLVALSTPEAGEYADMAAATSVAGASAYTPHIRRSSHDHGWSHVRQGYDFKDMNHVVFNNEPEGPGSSVVSMDSPLQLASTRLLGIVCGGAGYVLHVAQGVTGQAEPAYGRPANMWEVPNIETILDVVRACEILLPDGVENWHCVNNGRSEHPLPLDPHEGFWESGAEDKAPALNKNYAAIAGDEFVVMLTGVKSVSETGPVPAGTARQACSVVAFDPVSLAAVAETDLAAGQSWTLPGRGDSMAAYVIRGTRL